MSKKIYHRNSDLSGNDSLSKIAKLIKDNSLVLDIGAGPGVLGDFLRNKKKCIVDGIDFCEEAAKYAIGIYRNYHIADLDSACLKNFLFNEKYDYIICADIIEHLKNAEKLISQLKKFIKDDGAILFSIPNITYAGLIGELMKGNFVYREQGLLDENHIRFFTKKSLIKFCDDCGLRIVILDRGLLKLEESEFKIFKHELPDAIWSYILGQKESMTYQFVVLAKYSKASIVSNQNFLNDDCAVEKNAEPIEIKEYTKVLEKEIGNYKQHVINLEDELERYKKHTSNIEAELNEYKQHAKNLEIEVGNLRDAINKLNKYHSSLLSSYQTFLKNIKKS